MSRGKGIDPEILEAASVSHRRILSAHDSGLERRGRAQLRRQTGLPQSVVYEALKLDGRRSEGATILDLLTSLRSRGIEPAVFFREAFPLQGEDPIGSLQEARGVSNDDDPYRGLPAEMHAEQVRPKIIPSRLLGFIDAEARKIDDLRDERRDLALIRSTRWIEKCTPPENQASTARLFRNEEQYLRYLSAVGTWSSIHRASGRPDLAARGLEHALRLIGNQLSSAVGADLLLRAGMVLMDYLAYRPAVHLFLSAYTTLGIHGLPESATNALYRAAVSWGYQGRHDLALSTLSSCETMPHDEALDSAIASAYIFNAMALGNLSEALRVGHLLLSNNQLPKSHRAKTLALVAIAEGKVSPGSSQAEEHYGEAISLAMSFLEPGDLFIIFFEYSEMKAVCGDFEAIVEKCRELSGHLESLASSGSLVAKSIAEEFLREASSCQLAHREIKRYKKQFEAALGSQPPGTMTRPSSSSPPSASGGVGD